MNGGLRSPASASTGAWMRKSRATGSTPPVLKVQHGGVIGETKAKLSEAWPHRCAAHLRDHRRRHADVRQEGSQRRVVIAAGEERAQAPVVVDRQRCRRGVDAVGRFVEGDTGDVDSARSRLECQGGARRHAEECGRAAGLHDEGGNILDLAGDRIGMDVGAVAAAAPIVCEDRELGRQRARQGQPRRLAVSIVEGAANEDDRRAAANALVGDAGSVA